MTQTNTATSGTLTHRSGSSRKLLARKALAAMPVAGGETLEDVFPGASAENADAAGSGAPEVVTETAAAPVGEADDVTATAPANDVAALPPADVAEPASALPEPASPEQQPAPLPAAAWSDEDETTFQAMTARRRAAGYQRRGRDVSRQLLRVGDIAPNAGTVVEAICSVVRTHGTMSRAALLVIMAGPEFQYPKAKALDSWRQGYVAGALRDGFLALANDKPGDAAEVTR